jgi:hypothetical protein
VGAGEHERERAGQLDIDLAHHHPAADHVDRVGLADPFLQRDRGLAGVLGDVVEGLALGEQLLTRAERLLPGGDAGADRPPSPPGRRPAVAGRPGRCRSRRARERRPGASRRRGRGPGGRSSSWPRNASAASPVQADELSLDTFADASAKTFPAPVTSAAAELSDAASPGVGSKPSAGNSRTATCPSRVRSPAGRGPVVRDVISSSTGTPLLTGFGWF